MRYIRESPLPHHSNEILMVLGAGSLRPGCQHGWALVMAPSGLEKVPLSLCPQMVEGVEGSCMQKHGERYLFNFL